MASDFHWFLVEGSEFMAITNRKGCKKQTTYKQWDKIPSSKFLRGFLNHVKVAKIGP